MKKRRVPPVTAPITWSAPVGEPTPELRPAMVRFQWYGTIDKNNHMSGQWSLDPNHLLMRRDERIVTMWMTDPVLWDDPDGR